MCDRKRAAVPMTVGVFFGVFFNLPVKCFTLAQTWKGNLIEKLSGCGICHPPRCSVTTLIHAQPDHKAGGEPLYLAAGGWCTSQQKSIAKGGVAWGGGVVKGKDQRQWS